MGSRYECAWCGQTIKKTMQCASIMGTDTCYWVPLVREVGVKQAIRQSKGEREALSYEQPSNLNGVVE